VDTSYRTAQSVHQQILLLGLNWRRGKKVMFFQ